MSEEEKKEESFYKYRVYTLAGMAIPIMSEYSSRQELWKVIVNSEDKDGDLEFFYVDAGGNKIEISLRPSIIIGIDNSFGLAPVSMKENPAQPQGRVTYKRPNRIVIGQQAGAPGVAKVVPPAQRPKR